MTKILLVEDNELNRDMLSRRLERKGFDVAIATDGVQGIGMAQQMQPDLIIMDMSLPVMDGWEATKSLKSAAETRDIPIVGLSAHAMTGDKERALSVGCDDYETKPVDLERLISKIGSLIEKASRNG